MIAWRKLLIAGVAGYACGQGYSSLRQHRETVQPVVKYAAAAGVAGSVVGWGVAAYRNLPSHVYILSLGANCAVATGAFLGIRHAILYVLDSEDFQAAPFLQRLAFTKESLALVSQYVSSGASGGITGALASVLSGHGVKTIALTSCGGMVFGVCAQLLYFQFEVWRRRKALEIHYPELVQRPDRTQWSFHTFEERFLGFWHRYSKGAEVEDKIAQIKENIQEERRRISELDRILQLAPDDISDEVSGAHDSSGPPNVGPSNDSAFSSRRQLVSHSNR